MKKPTQKASRFEMSSKSARISRGDLTRMHAVALDKRHSNNEFVKTWQVNTAKAELKALVVYGPAVKLSNGTAKGAFERRKGGVIPGGKVFI